ncbi:uncharacterized protein EI90DRAFT_3018208 [Cantharellus anzutake]|uniref:uncharacterized protein n=1 Tax=Cantharellus anzutake TaxID=1750568 RepID=UPI00190837CB|nr:uncharacterized protein EI90DRAFT_3018208 [Cantharellus anzutake]KAF8327471.1 hypothetical protein EI90DRAFT_3018208 [Cantharellus anzutake]
MNTSILAKYEQLAASRAPTAKEKDIIPLVQAFTGTTSQYLRWIHSPQEKLEGCVDFFNGCIVSLDNIQEANGNTSLLAITLKNYHPMFLTALASWVSRLSPSDPFPPPCNCDHQNSLVRLCHINSFLDTPGSRRPTTTVILSKVLLWLGLCFNNLKHYRPASWPKSPQDLMPLGRLKYLRHVEDWLLALPCEEAGVLLSVLSGAAKLETSLVKDIHASETMGRTLLEVGQKLIRKYCTLRHTLALAELGVDGLHFMLQQFDVTTEAFASVLLLLVQKSHDKQLGNFMKGVHNVQALFELCRELVELTWVVVRHADPSGAESRLINGAHYTFLFLTLFFSPTYALPTLDLPSLLSSPPPHPVELSRKARSILVDRITDEFIWNYLLGSLHECYMARHCWDSQPGSHQPTPQIR